ncbi:hypothetical protein F5I97DRAFT_1801122 [Phlebopus sp. FC_14]|nr:hypothetical protein F5I97DRAFT_1801122 [Phlebopus sp. FC_14]
MPPKRKRRSSPAQKGLAAGEQLKRVKLAGNEVAAWGWVDVQVSNPSQITLEHRLMTCGLSTRNKNPFCGNKYASKSTKLIPPPPPEERKTEGANDDENDVIVISDDEKLPCDKKACKNNPNCLNYLGQEKWEDEDKARELFLKASDLGFNPLLHSRDPELPNLGATCYANAFLQVWFRDLAFRNGVYQCQPSQDTENKICEPNLTGSLQDSPIFQLQVTFAALQESTQSVYNPAKLAESLKLSTSEQQDAQEFSKLFMSHLDSEFQKQLTPSLQSLVSTQFQGQQIYGTICHSCRNRSEHTTDFLELEINIENNARLEDRIAALLQDEKLTGDNKYSCSNCSSLQDATRYVELRSLPPVLHFSLLRFVYDFTSMERRKSKHNLLFPTTLDMSKFVSSRESISGEEGHVYELRGVLLHKGASAYHGHYEAQVLDTASKTWFQFDDETVTKIGLLGEKRHSTKQVIDILNGEAKYVHPFFSSCWHPRPATLLTDYFCTCIEAQPNHPAHVPRGGEGSRTVKTRPSSTDIFSSKDVYMLIYARKERSLMDAIPAPSDASSLALSNGSPIGLLPPQRAHDVVKVLNVAHDEACEAYARKEKQAKEHFEKLRKWVRGVYQSWHVDSVTEDAVIVSRQALETWLSKPFVRKADRSRSQSAIEGEEVIPVADILCSHGALDPQKANNMKRISARAYEKLATREDCDIEPVRSPHDVCEVCVRESFTERLYQNEHPRIVAQFDHVCDVGQEETGYWLSKAWLKDWRLQKPRMHVPLRGDSPPDSAEFRGHVRCEHDRLSLVSTARRSISSEVSSCDLRIEKKLFPQWAPLSTDEELCSMCEALINSTKEDKRELRKKAEDEKARLRHMHDNALTGNTLLLENVPCAVLPAQFVRIWRKWLSRPTDAPRPDRVDTMPLFCEHGNLVFDPNAPNDWDNNIALVQMSEWLILGELYACGRVVAVEKRIVEDPVGVFDTKFVHQIPVCHGCRLQRRANYDLTDITVRLLGSKNPAADDRDGGGAPHQRSGENGKHESAHLGSRPVAGLRQSKRIRQGRDRHENTRVTVSKSTTIKDIKVMLSESMKIPTICQRLFYRDQELDDNKVTVEALGILMNDTLDLREEAEDDDSYTTNTDSRATKRRKEEKGFGGTLLAASASYASLSGSEGESPEMIKTCRACTFDNPPENLACEMCQESMIGG